MTEAASIEIRDLASLPAEPWKNGGGVTRTLARSDKDGSPGAPASEPMWRISLAEIARSGAYSSFPGMTRYSVILSGAGIDLQADRKQVALRPRQPTRYNGAPAWQALLLQDPCTALNVMVAEHAWHADVQALTGAPPATALPPASVMLLLCDSQGVSLASTSGQLQAAPVIVKPGQYALLKASNGEKLQLIASTVEGEATGLPKSAFAVLLNPA